MTFAHNVCKCIIRKPKTFSEYRKVCKLQVGGLLALSVPPLRIINPYHPTQPPATNAVYGTISRALQAVCQAVTTQAGREPESSLGDNLTSDHHTTLSPVSKAGERALSASWLVDKGLMRKGLMRKGRLNYSNDYFEIYCI